MLPLLLALADLVGFWHASPEVAAGHDAAYLFRADGTWEWHVADGTCKAGVWERQGAYTLKGTTLTLQEKTRKTYVGGKKATDEMGGCVMQGGKLVEKTHKKPVQSKVKLADCKAKDKEANPDVACIKFGKLAHWRLSEDPQRYFGEEGDAEFEEALKILTEMTDRKCACKDRACMHKVMKDTHALSDKLSNWEPNEERMKKMQPVMDRLKKCEEDFESKNQ